MKKYIIPALLILALATPSWAKRIYEYSAIDAVADTDKFLISDTSDSNREKTLTGSALKTYIGTGVAFTLGSLGDLKIDIGASDENLLSATPADKDLQTYTATQIDTLLSTAGSAPTIQADDPTSASAVGWYLATTSGDLFYRSSSGLFTFAGSYTVYAPTLSSRTIGTNGTTLTLVGSESLSVGAGGNGGFDVDCATAGTGITATYASGAPGSSLVYTLGTTVNSGDTCDLDYTQPGNGIEATTGGADLASITSGAITNNSTQGGGAAYTANFDTDANPLGSPWVTVTDMVNVRAVSGMAGGAVLDENSAAYYNDTTANDHYSEAKLVGTSGGVPRGVMVRASASEKSYYVVRQNSGTELVLYKRIAGSWTLLETITTNTTANDVLRLEASGTSLIVKVNGSTVHTETGQSDLTSGFAGIEFGNINSGVDDWAGGDL
jgi:hypothetical protein